MSKLVWFWYLGVQYLVPEECSSIVSNDKVGLYAVACISSEVYLKGGVHKGFMTDRHVFNAEVGQSEPLLRSSNDSLFFTFNPTKCQQFYDIESAKEWCEANCREPVKNV